MAQYVRTLGEHVGAPLTTHGPHPLHRVLVSTSPVVVHSLRMQSAWTVGVHWAAGGAVVVVVTVPPGMHGPQSLHAALAKSAGVAHLALVQ